MSGKIKVRAGRTATGGDASHQSYAQCLLFLKPTRFDPSLGFSAMVPPHHIPCLLPAKLLPNIAHGIVCRSRLSVSPATGLIGLPENGFLHDFFGCLGFIGIASEW